MSESKHTPGPWHATKIEFRGWVVGEDSGHKQAICEIPWADWWSVRSREYEANARLIAAAPNLLAALKEALPVLEFEAEARGDSDHLYEIPVRPILRVVLAVIAKAEGRSDE